MDRQGVLLKLPKINIAPLGNSLSTPSLYLPKNNKFTSFQTINESLNTQSLETKNMNCATKDTHEIMFTNQPLVSIESLKIRQESLPPRPIPNLYTLLSDNTPRDNNKNEETEESNIRVKDLKTANIQFPKQFLKKGDGSLHIGKSNSLPKIIHYVHIDFKNPTKINQNTQSNYFNKKNIKSDLFSIINRHNEKRNSLTLDKSININTMLTINPEDANMPRNISFLQSHDTSSLSIGQGMYQTRNGLTTGEKLENQKDHPPLQPLPSKKVDLTIGFDSVAHLAGPSKTVHISKLQGLSQYNSRFSSIPSISIPKLGSQSLSPFFKKISIIKGSRTESKFAQYNSKNNHLLDSNTGSGATSKQRDLQSIKSQIGSASLEKSFVIQEPDNGFEYIQKMLKMCNIKELEKYSNIKNKKLTQQYENDDFNNTNSLIHSYLQTNQLKTHDFSILEHKKMKKKQKFNLKDLNNDLILGDNYSSAFNKLNMSKTFNENKKPAMKILNDGTKIKSSSYFEKNTYAQSAKNSKLKSIFSDRKTTSIEKLPIQTKISIQLEPDMIKENRKIK